MTASPQSAFLLTIDFPLINESFSVPAEPVLAGLTHRALKELLEDQGECFRPEVTNQVLRLLQSETAIQDACARYEREYLRVNDQLLEHRGYGFDGDEEPGVRMDCDQLERWTAEHPCAVTENVTAPPLSQEDVDELAGACFVSGNIVAALVVAALYYTSPLPARALYFRGALPVAMMVSWPLLVMAQVTFLMPKFPRWGRALRGIRPRWMKRKPSA